MPCGSSASLGRSLERCLPSPSPGHLESGIWNSAPSPGNQKHRKRALNDFRFAPKPSKAVSSHPKAAEAALRLSLRNGYPPTCTGRSA